MLQMGHSLQKWIVGDMPGWPSIETEISGHGGAILGDYPLSGNLWPALSSLGSRTVRPTSALGDKTLLVSALHRRNGRC
jgi:hypothetical protein